MAVCGWDVPFFELSALAPGATDGTHETYGTYMLFPRRPATCPFEREKRQLSRNGRSATGLGV
jgi:hypothetical protein